MSRRSPRISDIEYNKSKARGLVYKAMKAGEIIRQPCSECGAEYGLAHHDDYDKPLNVRWLCRSCHAKVHAHQWRATMLAEFGDGRSVFPKPIARKKQGGTK